MIGEYKNLLDMFDGGGAGRSGDTFQGGGILSELANLVAKPRGYLERKQDNVLNRKNQTGRAIAKIVEVLNNSGNNFSALNRPRFRDIAEVTRLGNVTFDEFKELATKAYRDKGVDPSFEQIMDAYLNYLSRP